MGGTQTYEMIQESENVEQLTQLIAETGFLNRQK